MNVLKRLLAAGGLVGLVALGAQTSVLAGGGPGGPSCALAFGGGSAGAGAAQSIRFSGIAACASSFSYNSDGSSTVLSFAAVNGPISGMPGVSQSVATLDIMQLDQTGNVLSNISGYTPSSGLSINRNLTSASVQTSIPLCSYAGTKQCIDEGTAVVNLAFSGSGPLASTSISSRFHVSGFTMVSRFSEKTRFASVAGSILNGSTDYASIAPLSGELDSVSFASVAVSPQ